MGAFESHAGALIERGYAAFRSCPAAKFPATIAPGCGCRCLGWQKRYLDGRKPQLQTSRPGAPAIRPRVWSAARLRMGSSPSTSIPTNRDPGSDRQGVAGDAGLENRPERRDAIFLRTRHHDIVELEYRRQARL